MDAVPRFNRPGETYTLPFTCTTFVVYLRCRLEVCVSDTNCKSGRHSPMRSPCIGRDYKTITFPYSYSSVFWGPNSVFGTLVTNDVVDATFFPSVGKTCLSGIVTFLYDVLYYPLSIDRPGMQWRRCILLSCRRLPSSS